MRRDYPTKQCIALSNQYEQNPNQYFDADDYCCIFTHYYKTLQLSQAYDVISHAWSVYPTDLNICNCLGRCQIEYLQDYPAAKQTLQTALQLIQQPSVTELLEKEELLDLKSEIWELEGLYYLQKHQPQKARKAFYKAAQVPQEEYPRECDMAQIYIDKQQPEEAVLFLRAATEKAPKDKYVWQLLCDAYNKLNDYDQEVQAYQHLIDLDPYSCDNWTDLAMAYANKGDRDAAKDAFDYALSIDPDNATTWLFLGDFFTDEQAYDQALECYQHFYRLQPNNHEILLTIAKCYRLMNKLELAKDTFHAFLDIQPDSLDAQIGLGEIMYAQHKAKQAVQIFQEVTQKDPEKIEAWLYLGQIYHRFGDLDKAIDIFERIVSIQRNLEFILYLGNLYNEKKDYSSALFYFLEAEYIDASVENLELNIGIIYYELEEWEQAETHLTGAYALDPKSWDTFLQLYPNAKDKIHITL